MMMRAVAFAGALLALADPTTAMRRERADRQKNRVERGGTTTVDSYKSQSAGASLFVPLEETYESMCYEGPDYDEPTPCQQSCGGSNYYVNAYQDDGKERAVTLEASSSNECAEGDEGGVYYFACATVKVPEATWTRDGKTTVLKAAATLKDCGYYDEEGKQPPPNPLVGTKMEVDVTITCKRLDRGSNKCRDTSSGESGFTRSRNIYASEDCYVEGPVGTLVVNGSKMQFESASFGSYRSKTVTREFEADPRSKTGKKRRARKGRN